MQGEDSGRDDSRSSGLWVQRHCTDKTRVRQGTDAITGGDRES